MGPPWKEEYYGKCINHGEDGRALGVEDSSGTWPRRSLTQLK